MPVNRADSKSTGNLNAELAFIFKQTSQKKDEIESKRFLDRSIK
jgi:hypothetical protein